MTSRELCRRAIEFGKPERLPINYPSLGVFDAVLLHYTAPAGWEPSEPGEDEWGAVWQQTEVENMGQIVKHPVADWALLERYAFPSPNEDSRFDLIETELKKFPDKYVMASAAPVFTLWERYYSIRGFDQGLMDFYVYPDNAHALLERLLAFHVGIMKNLGRRFGGRIDGFLVSDDWGTQYSTLLAVPVWREFFKERYRRLCDAIHDAGMHAILHSDGKINDLLPDLVEVGFDAFHLHSPTVLGIEEVGRDFAGKAAFLACVDIQNTFARGTPEDVRSEAKMLLEHWGTPDGGFMACEYGREAVGAPEENLKAAYETFVELGVEHCGAAHRT